jgi:hypothetical protein
LEGRDFLAGGPLEVHSKPHRPDYNTDDAGSDILRHLPTFFGTELRYLFVVRLHLRADSGAVHVPILWLDHRNRRWRAPRTCPDAQQ